MMVSGISERDIPIYFSVHFNFVTCDSLVANEWRSFDKNFLQFSKQNLT